MSRRWYRQEMSWTAMGVFTAIGFAGWLFVFATVSLPPTFVALSFAVWICFVAMIAKRLQRKSSVASGRSQSAANDSH